MRASRLIVLFAALFCTPSVTLAKKGGNGHRGAHGAPAQSHQPPGQAKKGNGNWFKDRGYQQLDIPEGHYPPPGQCRAWFPGKPPGHQPPPGPCGSVRAPAGAWLIRHPADRPQHVHVTVFDPDRPSVVKVVGEFSIGTGAFLRVVLN